MVGHVVLFVVIAPTVDQDVVLLVMQAMCFIATFVQFPAITLCIGYVEID